MEAILLILLVLSPIAGIVTLVSGALRVESRAALKRVGIAGGVLLGLPCLLIMGVALGMATGLGGEPKLGGLLVASVVIVAVPLLVYLRFARRRLEKLEALKGR